MPSLSLRESVGEDLPAGLFFLLSIFFFTLLGSLKGPAGLVEGAQLRRRAVRAVDLGRGRGREREGSR